MLTIDNVFQRVFLFFVSVLTLVNDTIHSYIGYKQKIITKILTQ